MCIEIYNWFLPLDLVVGGGVLQRNLNYQPISIQRTLVISRQPHTMYFSTADILGSNKWWLCLTKMRLSSNLVDIDRLHARNRSRPDAYAWPSLLRHEPPLCVESRQIPNWSHGTVGALCYWLSGRNNDINWASSGTHTFITRVNLSTHGGHDNLSFILISNWIYLSLY